jgi:hypothetical protein
MDQKIPDHRWQQLQTHIEGFLGQALRGDLQRIEYKPRFIGQLRETPFHPQKERREQAT